MSDEDLQQHRRKLLAEGYDLDKWLEESRAKELRETIRSLEARLRSAEDRLPPAEELPAEELQNYFKIHEFRPTLLPWRFDRYPGRVDDFATELHRNCVHRPRMRLGGPTELVSITCEIVRLTAALMKSSSRYGSVEYYMFGQCRTCTQIYWTTVRRTR